MEAVQFIKIFILSTIFFIALDCLFIGYLMNSQYLHYLRPIARLNNDGLKPNLIAGLFVWMLIVFGMLIFVFPHIQSSNLIESFAWGALYGFVLYGVYDLTNFSVLAQWPLQITLIDIAWGTFANGALAVFMWYLNKIL